MKTLDIIKTANANLWRNKVRTLLTVLAIFVGSFTIILNSAINAGVNDFIDKQIDAIGGDGYIEIAPTAMYDQLQSMMDNKTITEYDSQKNAGDATTITEEDFKKIRSLDGVISAEPYYMAQAEYITSAQTDKKYNLTLAVIPNNNIHSDMTTGRQTDADSKEYEAMLSEDYREILGFNTNEEAIGRTVTLGVKQPIKCYTVKNPNDCIAKLDVKIVGIQAPSVLSMVGGVHVNPAANQAVYDLYSEGVAKDVKNRTPLAFGEVEPDKLDNIKSELEKSGFTAITIADEAGMIRSFFDVVLVVFNIFGIIALVAAAIGIINTLFMSVQERTREIGLDKALGLTSGKIFLSFSIEAILLGFWGSILGTGVSMIVGYTANSFLHQPDQVLADFPTFNLVKFAPQNVLPIILLIMFIAFLAGTLPARQAAKKDPIEALRYE